MPRLLRTPEEILRADPAKDLFLLRFSSAWIGIARLNPRPAGKATILKWFAENLPEVELEPLGFSEFSDFICGGASGDIAVHWTEEQMSMYCAKWEHPDGTSLDKRWQCLWYSQSEYADRLAKHGDPRKRHDV